MRKSAFTLVELLVVMAIISILAAMLLPTLEKGLFEARLLACKNNLKQQFLALNGYASDWRDQVPTARRISINDGGLNHNLYLSTAPWNAWDGNRRGMGLTTEYAGGLTDIFWCPSESWYASALPGQRNLWTGGNFNQNVKTSYAHGWITSTQWFVSDVQPLSFQEPVAKLLAAPGKKTIMLYAKSRKVLLTDATQNYWYPLSPTFHSRGAAQNILRVDGSLDTIRDYWTTLPPPAMLHQLYGTTPYNSNWWGLFGKR